MFDADTRTDALPRILMTEDIARALGVSVGQARRLVSSGRIPGRRCGRRYVVLREHFLRSLEPMPEDREDSDVR